MKFSLASTAALLSTFAFSVFADDDWKTTLDVGTTLDGGLTTLDGTYGLTLEDYSGSSKKLHKRSSDTSEFEKHQNTDGALAVTLSDSILYDAQGRIGSIVSNDQFQFDGPPPQAGAKYAVGWCTDSQGYLYLGDDDLFYKCSSGGFYNLYYSNVDESACSEISIKLVTLVD